MIRELRTAFNRNFSEDKYSLFLYEMNGLTPEKIPFRIAETPVFVPNDLSEKILNACNSIIDVIISDDYADKIADAVPQGMNVPGSMDKPLWMAFDFAVCENDRGELVPMLIELQGFPSLFFYQHILACQYRKHFNISSNVEHLFGQSEEEYIALMKNLILDGNDPENVILLEIEPEKQNTLIDFRLTEKYAGIKTVCISKIKSEGEKLYYEHNGKLIPVKRIYNRVIFDELFNRTDISPGFDITKYVDVTWAGHPNWYFEVSKYTMPYLKHPFVPETRFLSDVENMPYNLDDYVLKPLYSYAGSGVVFNVTEEDIRKVENPHQYILQKKVNYAPVIEVPEGKVKVELRIMFAWPSDAVRPRPIINMARLSRGEMIGVKYNRDFNWVGSSVGFFER
jgi:hypothetical protein